jgi:FkbM family methyltransferase
MGKGKNGVKGLLKKMGIYDYVKYSRLFRLYQHVCKRRVIDAHRKEVALYKRFLPDCRLIFDIGAYDGHKTAAFLELSDRVVAVEPDPQNFKLLNIRFRHQRQRVTLCRTAIADRDGMGTFFIHHEGSAFNTLNPEWKKVLEGDREDRWNETIRFPAGHELSVPTTTLDRLIGQYGVPDFIKIDVEGYEKRVFMGLTQRVPCVSFECLLPEFREDLLSILELLRARDGRTTFNVIDREALLFGEFISYTALLEWLAGTTLYSFDLVAK